MQTFSAIGERARLYSCFVHGHDRCSENKERRATGRRGLPVDRIGNILVGDNTVEKAKSQKPPGFAILQ